MPGPRQDGNLPQNADKRKREFGQKNGHRHSRDTSAPSLVSQLAFCRLRLLAEPRADVILSFLKVKFRIKTPVNTAERESSLGKEKSPEHTHWGIQN